MRCLARSCVVARLGLGILCLAAACASGASAAPIVLQSGADDPEWNGWTAQGLGNGTAAGPAIDDLGLDSWFIADGSSGAGSSLAYRHAVGAADIALGHDLGWILRAEVHLPIYPDAVGGSATLEFADGQRAYRLALGSAADGDPLAQLIGGPAVAAAAPPAIPEPPRTNYNLFELHYNPATHSANLWVNGGQWATGYEGVPSSDTYVRFGSISDADTGTSIWHRVEWEVVPVPEPSGFVTAAAALVGLFVATYALRKAEWM